MAVEGEFALDYLFARKGKLLELVEGRKRLMKTLLSSSNKCLYDDMWKVVVTVQLIPDTTVSVRELYTVRARCIRDLI
jgi:hypothetical protein